MFYTSLKRDDLLSIVQGEPVKHLLPILADQFRQVREFDSNPIAIWRENPVQTWPLPNILLVSAATKNEFLAWTSSFVKIKPLTAVIRILDHETFKTAGNH